MTLRKRTLALLIAAALTPQFAATAYAQAPGYAPPPAQAPTRIYVQAELDQMLAPIALYPDPLLSQVLMAATYPIEVVEAARWTRANPGLRGDAAVRAVQYQDWDPSVKSLCAFPQILNRMDEHLQWTENLGDAFLAQEADVMDSVQQLRQRAYASGHLRSTAQIRVVQEGPYFYVRPVLAELVYVPYYDPFVVYGDWRWPAYRPVAWAPWPGYVRPSGVSVGFWFGSPISLSANFFFGDFDWGRRSVRVVRPTAYYYRPPTVVVQNTYVNRNVSTWQHDPHHRRGAEYRQVEVRQRFASAQTERGTERRGEQRAAQAPVTREAQAPRLQQQAQPQARPEQTRPERREAREERQRSDAQPVERAQRQQAAERVQRQQQDQQREQARAAERSQRDQQRQQAEAARSQQRQQAEAARAQQQQAHQQQRQQAEAARAQQQQQRQQAREERKGQREERKEQHAGNKGD